VSDSVRDQADGLRRLFRRAAPSTIAFLGGRPRSGTTRVACAFARGLVARGVSVNLVDEHRGETGAASMLNARTRFDLWQVINGDALITQAVVLAGERLRLLPAARLAQQRNPLDAAQQCRLDQCWRTVGEGSDVVVIDASAGSGGRLSPLVARAGALVFVTGADSAAVMGAYLMLKQIVPAHPRLSLGLVVNRAAGGNQAAAIANNLGGLLAEQLGRRLSGFGWLPRINAECEIADHTATAGLEGLDALLPEALRRSSGDAADENCRILSGGAPLTPATAA
jgi:flagellar biosynthesis protein FlhG